MKKVQHPMPNYAEREVVQRIVAEADAAVLKSQSRDDEVRLELERLQRRYSLFELLIKRLSVVIAVAMSVLPLLVLTGLLKSLSNHSTTISVSSTTIGLVSALLIVVIVTTASWAKARSRKRQIVRLRQRVSDLELRLNTEDSLKRKPE